MSFCQKILEDFPIAQKCAENYPGIKNPVNGNDKNFIIFNLLQFKKTPLLLKFNPKRKMIQRICNVLNTFNIKYYQ